MESTEIEIQNSICEYLQIKKYFFWRQNTSPTLTPDGKGFRRMSRYSRTGIPDIIIVEKGLFVGLEVKRKNSTQSDSQKQFQKDLEKAGGRYYIVRSIDDIQKLGL